LYWSTSEDIQREEFFSTNMSGHVGDLNEEQEDALVELKEKIDNLENTELRDYAHNFCDDIVYLRFLRARKFNVDAAYEMLTEALRFRTSFQDKGVEAITVDSVSNELKSGKTFFHGTDKDGRPVCIVKVKNHDPAKIDPPEGQRFSLFMMEYARTLLKPPIETVTLVFDMTEAGMKNMDMKSLQFTVQSLQNYYPESLGKVLIYNSSWLVYGIWKVVKPWLDTVTAAKVFFIDKKTIKDYIPEDNLLTEYGGKDLWKYDVESFSALCSESLTASGHPEQ